MVKLMILNQHSWEAPQVHFHFQSYLVLFLTFCLFFLFVPTFFRIKIIIITNKKWIFDEVCGFSSATVVVLLYLQKQLSLHCGHPLHYGRSIMHISQHHPSLLRSPYLCNRSETAARKSGMLTTTIAQNTTIAVTLPRQQHQKLVSVNL